MESGCRGPGPQERGDGSRLQNNLGGGFAPAGPWGPIGQYLSQDRSQLTGFPAAELLAAVRRSLGAGSAEWRSVLDSAKYEHQKQALAALARLDEQRR